MSKQSFEKEFTTLRELGPEIFVLRGSTIIVEIQEPEEIKTAGGIVLASTSDHVRGNSTQAHRVEVGKVLMTGPGYWVEDESGKGSIEPLEVSPGAILLLPQYSTQPISQFPGIQRPTANKLAMAKMDQVLAYYPTQEAYELVKKKLNS